MSNNTFIPNALVGTPAAELITRIYAAANERKLVVSRFWNKTRYAGYAEWIAKNEKGSRVASVTLEGAEGKTLRAKSSQLLQSFLADIEKIPVYDPTNEPTYCLSHLVLLTPKGREQMESLGGVMQNGYWAYPPKHQDAVRGLIAGRGAAALGKLTEGEQMVVTSLVPGSDRTKVTAENVLILQIHEKTVRAALKAYKAGLYTSLGSAFPKSANEELKALGAHWDGEKRRWIILTAQAEAAKAVIARHQAVEDARIAEVVAAKKAAGIIEWSQGEGYGGEYLSKGELVYRSQGGVSRWYVITECSSRYFREDGMSFGVGDEQGRVYYYTARPATEAEYAEAEAERVEAEERRAKKAIVDKSLGAGGPFDISSGEWVPGDNVLRGEEVERDTRYRIYGAGDWFFVEEGSQYVWYVRNNGMDGDDWSRNNIRTGGAGGCGWRFEATPERLEIIALQRELNAGKGE